MLLKKVYDNHTVNDPSIIYTYTDEGKLETREWKRLHNSYRLKTTHPDGRFLPRPGERNSHAEPQRRRERESEPSHKRHRIHKKE